VAFEVVIIEDEHIDFHDIDFIAYLNPLLTSVSGHFEVKRADSSKLFRLVTSLGLGYSPQTLQLQS